MVILLPRCDKNDYFMGSRLLVVYYCMMQVTPVSNTTNDYSPCQRDILPYSDKRKQVTNRQNLRKWCLKIGLSMLYFQFRVLSTNTHSAERFSSQDIMTLHRCQCTCVTHFSHWREMPFSTSRVASFCQSSAELRSHCTVDKNKNLTHTMRHKYFKSIRKPTLVAHYTL